MFQVIPLKNPPRDDIKMNHTCNIEDMLFLLKISSWRYISLANISSFFHHASIKRILTLKRNDESSSCKGTFVQERQGKHVNISTYTL